MKKLKIQRPFGSVILQATILLFALCFALEVFTRTSLARKLLPLPSYASAHQQFDLQVENLKARVSKDGGLDCVIIGNSQTHHGINPDVVESTVQQMTGERLRCQNFSLGGLRPASANVMVSILIHEYHPSLIIYGSGLFDYAPSTLDVSHESLISSPWVQYKLGNLSFDGWLIDNSFAYRYYMGMDDFYLDRSRRMYPITEKGYLPAQGVTPAKFDSQIAGLDQIIRKLEINEEHARDLHNLIKLTQSECQIILLETPIIPAFFASSRRATKVYPAYLNLLESEAREAGILFWPTQGLDILPPGGWHDLLHLNTMGADVFSRYVGEELARAWLAHEIEFKK